MDRPQKEIIQDSEHDDLYFYKSGSNHCKKQMEIWFLYKLEKMKFPEFTIKTSRQLNIKINELIEEIKEQNEKL